MKGYTWIIGRSREDSEKNLESTKRSNIKHLGEKQPGGTHRPLTKKYHQNKYRSSSTTDSIPRESQLLITSDAFEETSNETHNSSLRPQIPQQTFHFGYDTVVRLIRSSSCKNIL